MEHRIFSVFSHMSIEAGSIETKDIVGIVIQAIMLVDHLFVYDGDGYKPWA